MFERLLEKDLGNWKINPYRKPLILRGARQVGKTSLIRKFGQDNFDNMIEINLEKRDQRELFDQAVSVDDFIKRINLLFDKKVIPGSTLLFIDEIQESKNVLELLRFFAEEYPELHVMAAGSLLEAQIGRDWSIPVGRVEYRCLYPLTFFEFLKARNKTGLLDELQSIKLGQNFAYSIMASEYFKEYVLLGGMPEVVNSFVETGNHGQARAIFSRLQTVYVDDIRKYSRSIENYKYLELVMEYGPRLAGSLFKYEKFGGSNYRSREISAAFQAVEKVMLLKQVQAINSTSLPVVPKSNRPKKLIWLDVGLVNFVNNAYSGMLVGEYQGKMKEQVVGQSLLASAGIEPFDFYYWSRDRDEGTAEVDFCFQYRSHMVGLEIKSGNVTQMKSLFSMANFDPKAALVRVSWDDLKVEKWRFSGKQYQVLSIPFYLIDRWKDFLE